MASQDPLLPLRLYTFIKEEVGPNRTLCIADLEKDDRLHAGEDQPTANQIRKALDHLVEGGFLSKVKDPQKNNKGFYSLPAIVFDEEINEQLMYEVILSELLEVYTGKMNTLDKSGIISPVTKPRELTSTGFLTVSTEDEFYFFTDDEFSSIKQVYDHYTNNSLTRIHLDNDRSDQYLVFQIRLSSKGFVLFALKPEDTGASVHSFWLNDLTNITPGNTISVDNTLQLEDVIRDLIRLSDSEIKELARPLNNQ